MTERDDRQPEDVDSPLHPAADPDLEDGEDVSETSPGKSVPNEEEPPADKPDESSN